jgi:mitochondrial distribution and morphology protein 34
MSFTFSWSPLIADTLSARELLTAALNKTPKPPIIVDDIVVTELNLGSTPPDLEILEIGDLAEDRFRGVFRMRYAGEAKIKLSTKVEGNPLRTSLETRRQGPAGGWTDPGCLAADSGLTIPLVITLSEFRLSGFVILVFSKQKGLTIVFRNDPLESLKVSSTFDSIPFVRDYLQRTIEERLRVLFMEDLPAILHRLSLRLWSEEYRELDNRLNLSGKEKNEEEEIPMDPLATPLQDPWDWSAIDGYEEGQVPPFSLDAPELRATFSQKNLLRLAALTESQRTLSLFTPNMRDTVFRAWAGTSDRTSGTQSPIFGLGHTPSLPALSRLQSSFGGSRIASSAPSADGSDLASERSVPMSNSWSTDSRPPLSRSTSYTSFGRHRPGHKKRKNRVINLRKSETPTSEINSSDADTMTTTPEPSVYASSAPSAIYEDREIETSIEARLQSPLPTQTVQFSRDGPSGKEEKRKATSLQAASIPEEDAPPPAYTPPVQPLTISSKLASALPSESTTQKPRHRPQLPLQHSRSYAHSSSSAQSTTSGSAIPLLRTLSGDKLFSLGGGHAQGGLASPIESSGGILEQAWMQKIAREIAKKVKEEQAKHPVVERVPPPPAYAR